MVKNKLIKNADLSVLSTFGLPARADRLFKLSTLEDLKHPALSEPDLLILGGGSNTVFLSDWPGLILLNQLRGIRTQDHGDKVLVSVGAGEPWHALVRYCLDQGWYGLENLILIPGSVGAAPIQNIGAYGVEVGSMIEQVVTWDRLAREIKTFTRDECAFAYRDSLFKQITDSRYLIIQVDFRLKKEFRPHADYPSLKQALDERTIDGACSQGKEGMQAARDLAATVMRLRRHRLPDPNRVANVGSFFKNPIVSAKQLEALLANFPGLPHWPITDRSQGEGNKLSAAWMIERLGFKGKQIGDVAVYINHALVLVNQGRATASDLEMLIAQITETVFKDFGVSLVPEPQLIKASV